jgi:hypothetical protein
MMTERGTHTQTTTNQQQPKFFALSSFQILTFSMIKLDNQEPQQHQSSSFGTDADNTTVRTHAAFVNKLYK